MRTATKYGFRAALPATICQDIKILLQFTPADLTYDLQAPGFPEYFQSRFGVMITRAGGYGPADRPCTATEWAQRLATYAASAQATDPDKSCRITRAQIQDAWEVWPARPTAPPPVNEVTPVTPVPLPSGQLTLF